MVTELKVGGQFLLLGRGENVLVCTGDGYTQVVLVLLLFGRARKRLGSESVIQVPSLSPEDGSYIFWAHCKLLCQHQPVKPHGRTAESQQLR